MKPVWDDVNALIFGDDEGEGDAVPTVHELLRAMAYGCPNDTAPDDVWRAYCEAMRTLAQRVIEQSGVVN